MQNQLRTEELKNEKEMKKKFKKNQTFSLKPFNGIVQK